MNSDTICPEQIDFQDNTSRISLKSIFSPVVRFYASMQNAYHVERQAKCVFAMSDKDLNEMGIERENIPSYLAKLC